MTSVAIPDELANELKIVADRNGKTSDEYVHQAIAMFLEKMEGVDGWYLARVHESIRQADRGDVVPGEAVMGRLAVKLSEIEQR